MNLRALLRFPARALDRLRRRLPDDVAAFLAAEEQTLGAELTVPCDAGALGILPRTELDDIFASPWLRSVWKEDERLQASVAFPEMTGGVNPGDQRALYYLALALQPGSLLEIGTHIGCSTAALALAVRRLDPGGGLLSVDIKDVNDPQKKTWLEHGAAHSPREVCQKIGCGHVVKFHVADSIDFLKSAEQHFDLIFLDGLHDARHVYREIPLALARLNPGGFIVLHDYFPDLRPLWSNNDLIPGPFLAVDRLIAEGAALSIRPLGRLPWPTKLKSHLTSLALLTGRDQGGLDRNLASVPPSNA